MPFDAESEDELFDLIVYDYPQKPDKKTISELSIDATELLLHVSVKYINHTWKVIFPYFFTRTKIIYCQSITIEAMLSEKIQRLTPFPRGNVRMSEEQIWID